MLKGTFIELAVHANRHLHNKLGNVCGREARVEAVAQGISM